MQYNRHNFKSKQKLTAQQMNEIEQGIVDLVDHANSSDGKLNLTIGTVTSGSTAAATFSNGKLNLVLPKGEKGEAGANGAAGAKGDTGATPNITIGTVTTGTDAAATITGTAESPMMNLVLPKGEKGEAGTNGAAGAKGDTGATPNITIGTVTTGTDAAATITGTAESPMMNLVLPKGEKGEAGTNGAAGAKGDTGPAGPAGEGLTEKAKTLLLTLLENATYDLYDVSSTLNALRAEWNVSSGGIGPAANGKATGDKAAE